MKNEEILKFIHYVEKLKDELRHNWTTEDRQESVAEHSWRMSIMAILMHQKLRNKVNLEKVLKIVAIHDLGEIVAGDVPAFDKARKEVQEKIENESMQKLKEDFNDPVINDIFDLWSEYEKCETEEAKFVKALDNMEVRIQHNESSIERWNKIEFERSQFAADKFVDYDEFLKEFNSLIKKESENKIKNESNKAFDEIVKRLEKK